MAPAVLGPPAALCPGPLDGPVLGRRSPGYFQMDPHGKPKHAPIHDLCAHAYMHSWIYVMRIYVRI